MNEIANYERRCNENWILQMICTKMLFHGSLLSVGSGNSLKATVDQKHKKRISSSLTELKVL